MIMASSTKTHLVQVALVSGRNRPEQNLGQGKLLAILNLGDPNPSNLVLI